MNAKLKNNHLPELFALHIKRNKPSMVTVNLTAKCNQQCIYCEIGGHIDSRLNAKLTEADLFWIIDQKNWSDW